MNDQQPEGDALEIERYELREAPTYRFDADRREFVQTLGTGLMIAAAARGARAQQSGGRRGGSPDAVPARLSDRIHVGVDGVVTVLTMKVEIGQGARTQITQAAAEELHLPVERIRVIMGDTAGPDDGGTVGSRTTPATIPAIRRAAAAAREALAHLAAAKLGVERSEVAMAEGEFAAGATGKKVTLAELAADGQLSARLDEAPRGEAAISSVDQWRVLGTSVPKTTGSAVVAGALKYPSDFTRPGMAYGQVLRPPQLGATLESIDLSAAEKLPGVAVIRDGAFVGCATKTSWLARRAIEALAKTARWTPPPPTPSSDELFAHLKATATDKSSGWPQPRSDQWGDGAEALAGVAKKLEATYQVAYIAHAPMEPRATVAEWTDGTLAVWTGTQQPGRVRDELSQSLRVAREKVHVTALDCGGGFGGKQTGEAAVEAARLAKGAGRPVSLRWTREEEFTWAYCRPAALIELRAGLDAAGNLLAWDFTNYNSGESGIATPYRTPHGRTRFLAADSPLRQGSYRALASTANTFARESAIDELAALAGIDPLEFRLAHLPDGRLKDVLQAAAKKFNWAERRAHLASGRGVGIACGTEKGSFVAACVEVEYAAGKAKVISVCQAFECGAIQNPGNLRAQCEGAIVQGLGGALFEEVRFKDGMLTNPRFSEYRVPRMSDLPNLDVVLVNRPDLASVGGGETPIITVAPAAANAVFHAAGVRSRTMPLLKDVAAS